MDDETREPPAAGRRRRANVAGGRTARHVVMVSPEEEGVLARLAAHHRVTIPRLLVESALSSEQRETPSDRRAAITQLFGMHRLLGAMSRNLNQLTKATHAGADVEGELRETMAAVRRTADRISDTVDDLGRTT